MLSVCHPWFNMPNAKRKQPASVSDSSARSPKRRRSGTLERGFANLTLDAPMLPIVVEPPSMPRPTTPSVPEITMKLSSWYEPEPDRIVITDLTSFSEEDADTDAPDAPTLISPALIERLKRPLASPLPAQPPTQALVLFRPLQIPTLTKPTDDAKPQTSDAPDDAMDVEP
ncbi:hypothetical protein C8F04DRAFT_1024950 [Mycena alexandri]|uniref:Uncharacterized protein n=1 Tax=Mycena alexandri TaxID=1745969 RepID=A0AAD6XEI2_9AGAR|nr:hypothetical protein C8F04DRAFT_1024950 [Mycena alexandri]